MNFNVKELKKILNYMKGIYTKPGLFKFFDYLIFKDNQIIVFNKFLKISAPLQSDIEFVIPANELYRILNNTKQDTIEIVIKKEDVYITIDNTKAIFPMPSDISIYYSNIPEIPDSWNNLPDNFIDGLKGCIKTIYKESPIFSQIFITDNLIYSSDSYRISKYYLSSNINKDIIIDWEYIKEINKLDVIYFYEDKEYYHFKTEDDIIISCEKNIDHYEDIEQYIENINLVQINITDTLYDDMNNLLIITNDTKKLDQTITINIDKNKSIFTGYGRKGKIELNYDIKNSIEISFKINPIFFKSALKDVSKLYYDINNNILIIKNDNYEQYIWVD